MENLPPRSLVNDVFQILDSRIQYIEYQLTKLSRQPFKSNQNTILSDPESLFSIEIIFKQIELHYRSLKLLQLLRSKLNSLNSPLIFELLTDSKYLEYDELHLKEELGIEDKGPVMVESKSEASQVSKTFD